MQPILIAYDGSPESEEAVETAASLLGPRPAVVLTVSPPLTFAEGVLSTASLLPGVLFEDLNSADALKRAETGAEHARKAGLDAEARELTGPSPWEGIVDVADEIDAAVVVVGSRGLNGLRELAVGSVSHAVASHTRRPVLVVPAGAKTKEES